MKVYENILKYMEVFQINAERTMVFGGIWEYMKVYEGKQTWFATVFGAKN